MFPLFESDINSYCATLAECEVVRASDTNYKLWIVFVFHFLYYLIHMLSRRCLLLLKVISTDIVLLWLIFVSSFVTFFPWSGIRS